MVICKNPVVLAPALKSIQRAAASLAGGGLTDLFPSITACISLNIFAAIFPHEHSDITMRMLHAYTSIALAITALICTNIVVMSRNSSEKIASALALLFSIIYTISNTKIVVTGMGVGNGQLYHFLEAIILAAGYFLFSISKDKVFS